MPPPPSQYERQALGCSLNSLGPLATDIMELALDGIDPPCGPEHYTRCKIFPIDPIIHHTSGCTLDAIFNNGSNLLLREPHALPE